MTEKDQARKLIVGKMSVSNDTFIMLFDSGLIDHEAVRNTLIREDYQRLIKNFEPLDARIEVAERFNVSESTVQKVIYGYLKK